MRFPGLKGIDRQRRPKDPQQSFWTNLSRCGAGPGRSSSCTSSCTLEFQQGRSPTPATCTDTSWCHRTVLRRKSRQRIWCESNRHHSAFWLCYWCSGQSRSYRWCSTVVSDFSDTNLGWSWSSLSCTWRCMLGTLQRRCLQESNPFRQRRHKSSRLQLHRVTWHSCTSKCPFVGTNDFHSLGHWVLRNLSC